MKNNYLLIVLLSVFPFVVQAQNLGFEATAATPPMNWDPVTGTWITNTTEARTGLQSMSISNPATGGTTINTVTPFLTTTSAGNYLISIGWAKANTTNAEVGFGYRTGASNTNPATPINITTSWARYAFVSTATVGANTYGASMRAYRVTTNPATTVYIDDFIVYASTSNVPDLSAPNPASAATISGNLISWTNGTDNGTPASGIGGVVILRTNGVSMPAPALNDQAMYDPVHGAAGVGSFVDNGNTWTVVTSINDNITTSFTDASAGSGPYTYVVYMRDMAYNYSAGAPVTIAAPCQDPPIVGTPAAFPSTPVCPGTAVALSVSGGTGGIGQTFQWQTSPTLAGPYTNIGSPQSTSSLVINPTSTGYYQAEIICNGGTPVTTAPIQVMVNAAPSGVFDINSAVPTGGTNFQTFADALNFISCGISGPVTFNVAAGSGPYNEQVIIPDISGTSSTSRITFNGNNASLQFLGTTTSERAVLKLDGADHITINNLNVTALASGTSGFGYGIQLLNDADSNIIQNCNISVDATSTSTSSYAGILINSNPASITGTGNSACDSNRIIGNAVTGGYAGIGIVANGSTFVVNDNHVINNTITDFYNYGIYLNGNQRTVIDGNDISRPFRAVVSDFEGIYLASGNTSTQISNNRLHDPFTANLASTSAAFCIYFNNSDAAPGFENVASNNLIYNIIGGTGNHNGFLISGSTDVKLYHNTIVLNDVAATCTDCAARGIYVQGSVTTVTNLDVRNNNIVISQGGTAPKQGIFFEPVDLSGYVLNNNNYYITSTGGTLNEVGRMGGSSTTATQGSGSSTLAGWQAISLKDSNSVSVDPMFVSPGTGDFTPSGPFDNLGAPAGVSMDITNTARAATPDIGAYEFNAPACPSTLNGGSAIASAASVCSGGAVVLGLTGYNAVDGQGFQWQSGPSATGPWTNIGSPATTPALYLTPSTTLYYQALVTCGSSTVPSSPVQVVSNSGFSGTYTINSALPASATNFTSFGAAVAELGCGIVGPVIFNVEPGSGPYTEQVVINPVPGASAVNTITFNGRGDTLQFSASTSNRFVIQLNGADHIIIDSLNILTLNATYGWGVHLIGQADSNIIRNSNIDVTGTTSTTADNSGGIVVSNSSSDPTIAGNNANHLQVINNTISGGYRGIIINASAGAVDGSAHLIENNTIRDFYADGVVLSNTDTARVIGNDIHRMNRVAVTTFAGIELSDDTRRTLVMNNKIHDTHTAATTQSGTSYGLFANANDVPAGVENYYINNVVYNFNSGTGTQYGIYENSSDGARFYHNTISLDHQSSTSGTTRGIFVNSTAAAPATNISFINNMISVTREGSGTKYAIYLDPGVGVTSNYNNLFIASPSGTVNLGFFATDFQSLSDWQTANGNIWDQQSKGNNPLFVDPSTADFTPNNGLIDNSGTAVGVITDITGATRGTPPDIGAYEFNVPMCSGLPNAGTATVNTDTFTTAACVGGSLFLQLQDYSIGSGITIQWEYSYDQNSWSWVPGASTTSTFTTTFAGPGPMYYRAVVTCLGAPAYSNVVTVNQNPMYYCYCSPNTGVTLHGTNSNINVNVTIPGTSLNNSTSAVGPDGYYFADPNVGTNTATLAQGASYTLNVTQSSTTSTYKSEAWIDWDMNGTFDATEYYLLTKTGNLSSVTFTPPSSPSPTGITGMRVRSFISSTTSYGAAGACDNISVGRETEDYVITIVAPPTCAQPSNLVIGPVAATTAAILWDPSTPPAGGGYDYYYSASSTNPTSTSTPDGTVLPGVTNVNLSGLTPETTYYVWVRGNCGPGDYSLWTGPATFTTACAAVVAPFAETFDNAATPQCWTNTGSEEWEFGTSATYGASADHTGNNGYFAWVDDSSPHNVGTTLTSPFIDISGLTNPQLRFYIWSNNTANNNNDTLIIEAFNGTAWMPIDSISQNLGAQWQELTYYLSSLGSSIVQLRFIVNENAATSSNINHDISIDDIHVESGPSCPIPSGLTAANTSTTSTDLNWTENGTATQWSIEYGPQGFTPGSGTYVTATATPNVTLSGLNLGSLYQVYVRAICSPTDSSSLSLPLTFATIPPNDTCLNAIDISDGLVHNGTTAGATQTMAPCDASSNGANDVWYSFTTGSAGSVTVTVNTTSTGTDIVLSVFDGTCGTLNILTPTASSNTTPVACVDGPAAGNEYGIYNVAAGTTYYVRIYGFEEEQGTFPIQVTGSPLAIKLKGIEAVNVGKRNRIDWNTASEDFGDKFELERSADGRNFTYLATVNAKGQPSTYSYWDEKPFSGVNHYRLKMKNAAGQSSYSAVVTATVKGNGLFSVEAFPNPVSDKLTVKVNGTTAANAEVTILDVTGKLISTVKVLNNEATVDMSGLAQGAYIVKYTDANNTQTIKVNKQ